MTEPDFFFIDMRNNKRFSSLNISPSYRKKPVLFFKLCIASSSSSKAFCIKFLFGCTARERETNRCFETEKKHLPKNINFISKKTCIEILSDLLVKVKQ